jgi:hypothetical protein
MASTKSEVAGGWVGVITGARRLGRRGHRWAALRGGEGRWRWMDFFG